MTLKKKKKNSLEMRLSNRKTHSNKNSKGVFGWGENREDEK